MHVKKEWPGNETMCVCCIDSGTTLAIYRTGNGVLMRLRSCPDFEGELMGTFMYTIIVFTRGSKE